LLILSFLVLGFAKAQNIQFEDAKFKKELLSASPNNRIAKDADGNSITIDANGDGEISQAEALNIYQLDIGGRKGKFDIGWKKIVSIKGIEYFANLTTLSCALSKQKSLDLSKNINLQFLYLSAEIQTLDISKNINLTELYLRNCTGITSLYMKNGVKKNFNNNIGYGFRGTNLNYICCDEDEIDDVKKYMKNLAAEKSLAKGWQFSNLTVTSDCGTESTKEIPQEKTDSYPNP